MKFEIRNRWTGAVKFVAEIDANEDTPYRLKVRFAIQWAINNDADLTRADLTRADLTDANLTDANLTDADLTRADLTRADLTRADLTRADLTDANLTRANLTRANLTRANLTRADLTDANLTRANLNSLKYDLFGRLAVWPNEADGLLAAIREGKVDGRVYEGECCCFIGTVANLKGVNYCELNGLIADASSPTERFFMGIKKGDTPETNSASKIVEGFLVDFIKYRDNSRMAL